jgi:hypothetical protein
VLELGRLNPGGPSLVGWATRGGHVALRWPGGSALIVLALTAPAAGIEEGARAAAAHAAFEDLSHRSR